MVAQQARQYSTEHDIAKQTLLEQRMLTNIMQAVRETLAWEPRANDITRKLASVRFVMASLGRHLDHMFDLEERDGYMRATVESAPHLDGMVKGLREEHDEFRRIVHNLTSRLERIGAQDRNDLEKDCIEIGDLLCRLDEHTRREADVMQEALLRDEGGEGG
jgi:hemerythrin-like domain-containing protein